MKNCLIIAIPRSGSSNLLSSISSAYSLKSVFEPFTNHTNIYPSYYVNSVCKMIVYRLPYKKILYFAENFDKVILLSRRNTLEAAESMTAMCHDLDSNSKTVWNEVSDKHKNLIPLYTDKMIEWKNTIESLSNYLNIDIDYYEDLFLNKSLLDKSIELNLEYFNSDRKLRGKQGSILI